MCAIINEKGRENADMWQGFGSGASAEKSIAGFIARLQSSLLEFALPWTGEQTARIGGVSSSANTAINDEGLEDAPDDDDGEAALGDAFVHEQTQSTDVAAAAAAAGAGTAPTGAGSGPTGPSIVGVGSDGAQAAESRAKRGKSSSSNGGAAGSADAGYSPPGDLVPPRCPGEPLTYPESQLLISTIIRCFQSLEHPTVRKNVMQLVSLPTWGCVTPGAVSRELRRHPGLKGFWQKIVARRATR